MKKLFFLPLTATLLSACSTQEPAPVVNVGADNQTISSTNNETVDTSWNEEDVKQLPTADNMPNSIADNKMNSSRSDLILDNNFYIPRDAAGTPNYNKLIKGSYRAQQYQVRQGDSLFLISYISGIPLEEIAKLNHLTKPYDLQLGQIIQLTVDRNTKGMLSTTAADSKKIYIPRNSRTNKPEYNQIEKGFYHGNTYTVNKGDTLYLVSYISGQDVEDIARLNNLSPPYDLRTGQILKLSPTTTNKESYSEKDTNYAKTSTNTNKVHSVETTQNIKDTKQPHFTRTLIWQWPTAGKVVSSYSYADGGNKGIDVVGQMGQPIFAATSGQIVYAGNALQGYGNLIIIKHNDDYLSAYAHNQKILVKDKEWVKAGQKIATMGNTGTNRVGLHFEVRYKGQSVDPMRYLPKKQ